MLLYWYDEFGLKWQDISPLVKKHVATRSVSDDGEVRMRNRV